LVQREQHGWTSWATVASALSAVASALRHLPEYSTSRVSIDLMKDDVAFASAARRAQQLARVTKRFALAAAMTQAGYEAICVAIKDPVVRLFLQLGWAFAARMGDLRQVEGRDVEFESATGDRQTLQATFRAGKGAAFWGPFTVATVVTASIAKDLSLLIKQRGSMGPLFRPSEQQTLSKIVREHELDLRSIRRGRLQHLAQLGVTSEQLRLLSGHRRMDTLLRYLGWGRWSSDSSAAAQAREATEDAHRITGGDAPEPPKMGLHSGFSGLKGQRVVKGCGFLPHKPPKRRDLGIEPSPAAVASWPLKAKKIGTLSWERIRQSLGSASRVNAEYEMPDAAWHEVDHNIDVCERWCSSDPMAGLADSQVDYRTIPKTRISRADYDTIVAADKLAPLANDESIKGWAVGYLIPQVPKEQRRPVWEPALNRQHLEGQPSVSYPARRTRRYLRGFGFTADFDFMQYFDQLPLTPQAQLFHCVRYAVAEADGSVTESVMKLTRLPMGATHAPAVAQLLTNTVIAPLLHLRGIRVFSMIDNVRIAAAQEDIFLRAIQLFRDRCAEAGIQLNEVEWPEGSAPVPMARMTDDDWIRLGRAPNKIFLGEQYGSNATIRNSPKNRAKLRLTWARLLAAQQTASAHEYTFRHLISCISLVLYLSHTHDIHLSQCHDVLRALSRLTIRAIHQGYDRPLEYIDDRLVSNLARLVRQIETLDESWSPLPETPKEPSAVEHDYDIIINTDASATTWAAFLYFPATGVQVLLRQGWHGEERWDLSTVAEPTAVRRALMWISSADGTALLRSQNLHSESQLRIALVTDHAPLVSGQTRWWSQNGGFSLNPMLNGAFEMMHRMGVVAFHIPGHLNPADGPSRTKADPVIAVTNTTGQTGLGIPLRALACPFAKGQYSAMEAPRMMG